MHGRYQFVFEAIAVSSVIVVVDLLLGFILLFAFAGVSVFLIVSNALTVEFGGMLIVGGCLMARQPLVDEQRYDSSGKPTTAWRHAVVGRQVLVSSVFVLLFAILFALLETTSGV